jgi:hypothetical protein
MGRESTRKYPPIWSFLWISSHCEYLAVRSGAGYFHVTFCDSRRIPHHDPYPPFCGGSEMLGERHLKSPYQGVLCTDGGSAAVGLLALLSGVLPGLVSRAGCRQRCRVQPRRCPERDRVAISQNAAFLASWPAAAVRPMGVLGYQQSEGECV